MAKNQKNQNAGQIPYPKKLDLGELPTMDDADLYATQRSLVESISRVNDLSLNSVPWEVELCYVQREVQIRAARKEAHARFVSAAGAH